MSKNFELMQKVGKEPAISYSSSLKTPTVGSSSNGNGLVNGDGLDLDQIAQDELLKKLVQRVFGAQGKESPKIVHTASGEAWQQLEMFDLRIA
jgi:hypothetical protein